ncbi:class I SAM-dependent methyltransferase [Xenophilus sp. Marseille-Q4582]|uniref:class I SAM-dependent methyltransferase n=1 Tax=Xenophilus sp. Marseille-Q4582 TaxID=2866600 RepID=UPI001CE42EA8|nr:class I SAM-dependent methyltransferase [Xenophilus sp. Marseille-Q4582]
MRPHLLLRRQALLRLGRLGSLAAATALPVPALAQLREPGHGGSWEPTRGQAGKDVIWIPTPDALVQRMLQMAEVQADDHVYDLGSGDGKIAIAAGRAGALATGLEFDPRMVELSRRLAREAGVHERVRFEKADIFEADFSKATVVTLYLLPELNLRLRPRLFELPPGTRVVSHSFGMGEWQPDERSRIGSGELFLWRIPANVSGHWRFNAAAGSGLPQSMQVRQTFQKLQAEASDGSLTAALIEPRIDGRTLQFGLRDSAGRAVKLRAEVQGNRLRGSYQRGTAPPQPFEAERTGPPDTIVGSAYVEGGT